MDVTDTDSLHRVLAQLRTFGTDHQWVEAKRSRRGLPGDLWMSMSAFANSDTGGLVLLGVHEADGLFDVTGVDDAAAITAALQAACAQLDPALRPAINLVAHPDGTVITAMIPSLPSGRRPCHREGTSPYDTSYIRVGDADQRMTRDEVDELLAARSRIAHDRSAAPAGAELDSNAVARLLETVRMRSERLAALSDGEVLEHLGITDGGQLTIAGHLTVGAAPERHLGAARILRERPGPAGARADLSRSEGTIPELLDQTMQWLWQTLPVSQQPTDDGNLVDRLQVPAVALREAVANALLHRSLTDERLEQQTRVTITEKLVTVTSPGTVPPGLDITDLGLRPLSSPRNATLARMCEYVQTADGSRVAEMAATGLRAADAACIAAELLPPVVTAAGGLFTVHFVRASRPAQKQLLGAVSVLLASLVAAGALPASVELDLPYATRVLGITPDQAALALSDAVRARELVRVMRAGSPVWRPPPPAPTEQLHRRMPELLAALSAGPRAPAQLQQDLGYASRRGLLTLVEVAIEEGLVARPEGSAHDPHRIYQLTAEGRRRA